MPSSLTLLQLPETKMIQFHKHIFQRGGFNHQLVKIFSQKNDEVLPNSSQHTDGNVMVMILAA